MVAALPRDIERVLLDEQTIAAAVDQLAARLTADYAHRNPVVVGALTGAVVFAADLIRRLNWPLTLDFVSVSSYHHGSESGGELRWEKALTVDVTGRPVVLVEDIADSGYTLAELREAFGAMGASDVAVCVLLDKPSRRQVQVPLEYVGLQIPDEFVVGYGLDFAQRYRNLPYVGVLRREAYAPGT